MKSAGVAQDFEELYQLHSRPVYCLCLRMTANVADAEDLSQEVFIQLIRKLGSFRVESAFTSWLHRLTVNQVLMHYRKRRARPKEAGDDSLVHGKVGNGVSQPNQLSVMDRLLVDRAISTLPEKYRAPLVLRDVEGKSYDEIASILRTSEGTVKSRINRARNFLRDKMSNYIQVVSS